MSFAEALPSVLALLILTVVSAVFAWPPGRTKVDSSRFTCAHCQNENRVRDSFLDRNMPPPPRRPTPPPIIFIREGWGQVGRECSDCKQIFG
jgi:hypothetical protein